MNILNDLSLEEIARVIRIDTFKSVYSADSGHIGSSLSIVDIITALYHDSKMKFDPKEPNWEERDYFILSNGHAVPGLYTCLAHAGFYSPKKLDGLRKLGTPLEGHAKKGTFPGIEVSAGSLGQGLNVGLGLALGLKLRNKMNKVIVMMSDGDQQEGSTWEAYMYASKLNLQNIIGIIDRNGNQINGSSDEIMPGLNPLPAKYVAFNWEVIEIDGHNFKEIVPALDYAINARKPIVIISNSITAKGISFMEGNYKWHHGHITDKQFREAMKDLGAKVSEEPDETWLPGNVESYNLGER